MTKLTTSSLESFFKSAGRNYKAILFYGSDEGLVEECKARAIKAITPTKDAFLLAELTPSQIKEDVGLLSSEVNAMSLMGGRRVIVIRGVDNYFTATMKNFLPTYKGDALVVLTAKSLKTSDSLPTLFSKASDLAVFPCYADEGEALKRFVLQNIRENGFQTTPEVISFLVENLGADRLQSRSEMLKLFAYMGEETNISLNDVQACIGDASLLSIEQLLYAMTGGNQTQLNQTLDRLFSEGQTAIGLLRIASAHFKKFHVVLSKISQGVSQEMAIKSLFFHFKSVPIVESQLRLWNINKIARALDLIAKAEQDCKISAFPPQLICARVFLTITAQAMKRNA